MEVVAARPHAGRRQRRAASVDPVALLHPRGGPLRHDDQRRAQRRRRALHDDRRARQEGALLGGVDLLPAAAQGGREVYLYEAGFLHAKTLTADGQITAVGTMNMDIRSLRLHKELMLWMYDEKLAYRQERLFEEDIANSREVTLHGPRRPQPDGALPQLVHAAAVVLHLSQVLGNRASQLTSLWRRRESNPRVSTGISCAIKSLRTQVLDFRPSRPAKVRRVPRRMANSNRYGAGGFKTMVVAASANGAGRSRTSTAFRLNSDARSMHRIIVVWDDGGAPPWEGAERREARVDIAIPTGLGEARKRGWSARPTCSSPSPAISNALGIALALKTGKPVVGIDTWELSRRGVPATEIVRRSPCSCAGPPGRPMQPATSTLSWLPHATTRKRGKKEHSTRLLTNPRSKAPPRSSSRSRTKDSEGGGRHRREQGRRRRAYGNPTGRCTRP